MERIVLPKSLVDKMNDQIIQDPGIPMPNPTVSAWQEPPHPLATVQSRNLPEYTDVAIIGSGITGCAAAKTILENDHDQTKHVTMFEARCLTTGATSRNGGFLLSHVPMLYGRFVDAFGADAAKEIATFCDLTLEDIVKTAESEGLLETSEIRDATTVMVFEEKEAFEEAGQSVRMYEKAVRRGEEHFDIIDEESARKNHHLKLAKGAILVKSRVFWPYKLVTGLLQQMLGRYSTRFAIETNTAVTSIEVSTDTDSDYPYTLTTPRGVVRAAKVFHCVNGFTGHLIPKLRGSLFPCRLSMSSQKEGPQWGNKPYSWLFHSKQCWDPTTTVSEQGLYWMQQNAKTGLLFVGGDRQRLDDFITSDDSVIGSESAANLATLLPQRIFSQGWTNPVTGETLSSAPSIHRLWSGIIGMTADQVPLVGNLSKKVTGRGVEGGEWIAAGFNGYGMCQAWLCGRAIARMAFEDAKPEWLPDCYLSNDQRLTNINMSPQAAMISFFTRW